MFGKTAVFCVVRDLRVKTFKKEQNQSQQVEVTLETPLTRDLAEDILPAMARDLYRKVDKEWVAAPELGEASFLLPIDPQLVELQNHPDLPVEAKLDSVSIKQVWAKKADGGSWDLSFVMFFQLGEIDPVILLIKRLKQGIFVTTKTQEPKLPMDGDGPVVDADAPPEQAQPGLTLAKGRKRPTAAEKQARKQKALPPVPDVVEQPDPQQPPTTD